MQRAVGKLVGKHAHTLKNVWAALPPSGVFGAVILGAGGFSSPKTASCLGHSTRSLGTASRSSCAPFTDAGEAVLASSPAPSRMELPRVLSHVCMLEEANPAGNVHGGSLLKHVEQAGAIAASRHCASVVSAGVYPEGLHVVTAGLENMDFKRPVVVGNVIHLHSRVTFTSSRSLRVVVDVFAEDIMKGTMELANTACIWYVGLAPTKDGKGFTPVPVPQFTPTTEEEMAEYVAGRDMYDQRQAVSPADGASAAWDVSDWDPPACGRSPTQPPARSPAASTIQLSQVMLPSDCRGFDFSAPVQGGVIMKIMDTAAGVCAAKYCKTNVVTASLDALNFEVPIHRGDLVIVTGRPTYSSGRSMEIEVLVEKENRSGRTPALHGLFTMISLDGEGRPLPIPPLNLVTESEKARFDAGRLRYEARKAARDAARKTSGGKTSGGSTPKPASESKSEPASSA